MTTRKIEKEEWKAFFDSVSHSGSLNQKRAEIEVIGLNIGDQLAAEWVALLGISYDSRSDMLEIGLEGLNHLIHRPKLIFVEELGTALRSISITDEDDAQHIVRLRDPILLSGSGDAKNI